MSNADPVGSWTPPAPVRHRPHPVAYVLAVVLPLLLVASIATPIGLAWAAGRGRLGPLPGPLLGAPETGAGVGDPYFPDYGSSGYDAVSYTLDLSWEPGPDRLGGTAVISARSVRPLEAIYLDLALPVSAVRVNGVEAAYELEGFQDLRIEAPNPIAADTDFEVELTYGGHPEDVSRGGKNPWQQTGQEWTVAGEPESSAWWYPANDHPSDPATLDVSIRVPAGMEAISTGALVSRDTEQETDFDTWRWVTSQPAVTYATFLSIGQYVLREGTVDERPFVYAVSEQLPPEERARAFVQLENSASVVTELEAVFGPYPFSEIGGVVPAHDGFRFAGLETQTRPVYDRGAILSDDAERIVVHELAHMWFGDSVTLAQWNDIFINEGYASWAEWVTAERSGGRSGREILDRAYDATKDRADFWQVTMIDPGRDRLFATVYTRGPMVLQALRNVIGDPAFAKLTREWAQRPGARSVEEWMTAAQATTSVDLTPFFQAWIFGSTVPADTAANGLG